MREIKFRVYDTADKKYVNIKDFHLVFDWYGKLIAEPRQYIIGQRNKYILEQFTGLHDKNGVEIYEGDIVEFEYNNAKMIKEVYWDNEWNCWKVYINGGNIHTLNSHSMGYLIPTVIGNIHEEV